MYGFWIGGPHALIISYGLYKKEQTLENPKEEKFYFIKYSENVRKTTLKLHKNECFP